MDLIVGAADLDGQRSRPLKGRYSVDGALGTLLAGTGLGYRTDQQAESGRVTVRLIPAPPAQSAAHQLEDVVVSAARGHTVAGKSPRKITMISRQQIEEQMAISDDPGAVLANLIPSYSPSRQKLSNTGETFRGRTPQFLIDGVPQSNPLRNGGRASHTIDLSMVERIEVIHGASAEYGLGATGGIINFVTRRPEKPGFQQHVGVSLTSDDDFQSDGLGHKLDYRFTGQTESWDIVAAASRQERGLFYDGRDRIVGFAYPGEIQDSTSHDLFLKAGYWLDDNQNITVSANHFELEGHHDYRAVPGDRDAGLPTTATKGGAEGDPMFNKVTTLRARYSHGNWLGNEIDAQVYHQDFEGQFGALRSGSFQDPALAPIGTLLDQTRNESEKLGSQFTLKRRGLLRDRLDLAAGFDALSDETRQSLVLTDRVYVPETEYRNYAGFLQLDLRPTERLAFSGGARHEFAKLKVGEYRTVADNGAVLVDGGDPDFEETCTTSASPISSPTIFNCSPTTPRASACRTWAGCCAASTSPVRTWTPCWLWSPSSPITGKRACVSTANARGLKSAISNPIRITASGSARRTASTWSTVRRWRSRVWRRPWTGVPATPTNWDSPTPTRKANPTPTAMAPWTPP